MSLKTVLIQQVISGFLQSGIITRLVDDDIKLLEHVALYADKRVKDLLNSGLELVPTTSSVQEKAAAGANTAQDKPDTANVAIAQTVPAAPIPPSTDEQQESLPLGTLDRGAEPQDVGELLTTKAPPEEVAFDPTDPPPDYTRLPAIKGATAA